MKTRLSAAGLGLLFVLTLASAGTALATEAPAAGHWAAAWAAAPQPVPANAQLPVAEVENQTIRQTVRLTLGGSRLQIRLSNEYGARPLRIGAASVAIGGAMRTLTFGGAPSVVIPAGAPALSDPVELTAPRMGEATVSLYLPERTRIDTVHLVGLHTTLVSGPGDFTRSADFPVAARAPYRPYLSSVSVWASGPTRVVAAFGASIVDGFRSTPDSYAGWPDRLAERLKGRAGPSVGVINLGIAGNMVAADATGSSALARFDRDILSQPGLTHIILLEGRNDLAALAGPRTPPAQLGKGADADTLFAAYRQILARAHQKGIKVLVGPITPDGTAGWDDHKEAERRKLNAMVRQSGLFDGFIDFDTPLQNPAAPGLRPEYDSGDHLHPSDAGYKVMADAVDLRLFDAR